MTDYFVNNMWQLWALIAIVCLIAELSTGTFYIMCFAIGAFVSTLIAAMGFGFWPQTIVWAIVSVLSIVLVRPFAVRYLSHGKDDGRLSNADALIGQEGTVSEDIEADGFGRVAIDGDDWKARSASNTAIAKGERVRVVSRDSIIITVVPAGEPAATESDDEL